MTDAPDSRLAAGDCRCGCGALLARRTPRGVELKCRRCKRVWRLDPSTTIWTEADAPSARPEAASSEPISRGSGTLPA